VVERYLRATLTESDSNAKRIMHDTLQSVKHCQFEVTDPATDESALMRILDVFLCMIECRAGMLLDSEDIVDILRSVLRIGRETRPSEVLRQASEKVLHRIVEIVWRRFLELNDGEELESANMTPASANHARSQSLGAEQESQPNTFPEGATSVGSVSSPTSPQTIHALPQHHITTTHQAYNQKAFLILEFIYELANPQSAQGGKSTSLRILGTSLINITLETLGESILKYPSLINKVKNQLFRILLSNACSTPNIQLLQLSLRAFYNAVVSMPMHLHDQIEVFLHSTHIHISENKKASFEQQQLIMESLIELFSEGNFPLFLYHHYDCTSTSSNLFELLCKFLCKKVKECDEHLNKLHVLALRAILAIVSCLHDRCDVLTPPTMVAASKGIGPMSEGIEGVKNSSVDILLTGKGDLSDGDLTPPSSDLDSSISSESFDSEGYKVYRKRWDQKQKMMKFAEAISQNPAKGVQLLRQSKFLSEEEATPKQVAEFLWGYRNWMSKTAVGEVLRENKDFYVKVLEEYMEFFDFHGLRVDQALRHMTSTFFLTGEGQQIQRILEKFSHTYFNQNLDSYLKNQDNVWMFAVAIIMLHSDLHKPQNPNKMSLEDFRHNTTNSLDEGIEVPVEDLEDIYYSISKTEMETVLYCDSFKSDSAWQELVHHSEEYCKGEIQSNSGAELTNPLIEMPVNHDPYMFERLWTVAGVATRIVLDSTDDEVLLNIAITGLRQAARVAAHYNMTKAFDNYVISLCKFTNDLSPHHDNSVMIFGENAKAQLASRTVFAITRAHGGCLREGWKNILDLILRVYELELLPENILLEREEISLKKLKTYVKPKKMEPRKRSSSSAGSFWGGFWGGSNSDDSLLEEQSRKKAEECIEQCRIPDLLNEAKFLHAPSLEYLVKALIICGQQQQNIDVYSSMFCLDLLTDISISNKHRLEIIWQYVVDFLGNMLSGVCSRFKQNANRMKKREHIVLEHTVIAMLRLYIQLLPEKENTTPSQPSPEIDDSTDTTMRKKEMNIHQLIYYLSVPPQVLVYVLPQVCSCIEILINQHASQIHDAKAWEIILSILRQGVTHQEALNKSIQLTTKIVEEGFYVMPRNIPAAVHALMNIHTQDVPALMMNLHLRMLEKIPPSDDSEDNNSATDHDQVSEEQEWFQCWMCIVEGLGKLCTSIDSNVRSNSFSILQRISLSPQILDLPPDVLLLFFEKVHIMLIDELFSPAMSQRSSSVRDMWQEALTRATNVLIKTYLHLLPILIAIDRVEDVWLEVLRRLKQAMATNAPPLYDSVPEHIKNMYLVMQASQIPLDEDTSIFQKTKDVLQEYAIFGEMFEPVNPSNEGHSLEDGSGDQLSEPNAATEDDSAENVQPDDRERHSEQQNVVQTNDPTNQSPQQTQTATAE